MAVEKICVQCSNVFSIPNRRSDLVKFCSRQCRTEAGRATFACVQCGSTFSRPKSDNPDAIHRYCSPACHHSSKKGLKHKINPDSVRYYKVCEVCKVSFRVTLTRKETARFCSMKCKSESLAFKEECSVSQRGEKHWRWTGGLYKTGTGYIRHKSKVNDSEKFSFNHRLIVLSAILEHDQNHPFLIEVDGIKKLRTEIEVHHIDRNRSNNELSNLLAVTKFAHAQIHHRNREPKPWECWPCNPKTW